MAQGMKMDPKKVRSLLGRELSKDEMKTVLKATEAYLKGAGQARKGQTRKKVVEVFIKMLHPKQLKRFEDAIETLHGMNNFERFRTQVYLILVDSCYVGVELAQLMSQPGNKAGSK